MSEPEAIKQTIKKNKKPERRTHTERTELSDARMFDAAESLILEVGTQKTTLREVGERAGYSRGLANARFGNKETLFLKLSDRCRSHWMKEAQKAASGKSGLAAFLSRIDAAATYAEQYPNDARVLYILWFESVGASSSMRESLARFHQRAREDISKLIREAMEAGEVPANVDPDRLALMYNSAMFGLCYQWLVNPDLTDIRSAITFIKEQMLRVLRPHH